MSKILVPSAGPDSWRQFLTKPDLHWATGYSARTMAHAWEANGGLPPEIAASLEAVFGPVEALLVIPERKTPLPGGTRDSQSDALLLARHASGLIACAVEAKVDEPFGPTVGEWLVGASAGKFERLAYICGLLGIADCPLDIHYQLLHRTAAAMIEAERFCTAELAMIVHSWSPERRWFAAYERFTNLFSGVRRDASMIVGTPSGRRLLLDWVAGDDRFRSM